jgi:hypothetical protein
MSEMPELAQIHEAVHNILNDTGGMRADVSRLRLDFDKLADAAERRNGRIGQSETRIAALENSQLSKGDIMKFAIGVFAAAAPLFAALQWFVRHLGH